MILIQDLGSPREVMLDLGTLRPRHADHPVDVAAQHRGLGGHGRHHPELGQFGPDLVASLLGHFSGDDLLFEFAGLVRRFVHLSQFFLNRLHLLIEVILALRLLHLLFNAPANAFLDLEDIHLGAHETHQVFEARFDRGDFQNLLLLAQFHAHVRGDGVREPARLIDPGEGSQHLGGNLPAQRHVLFKVRRSAAHQRLRFALIRLTAFDLAHAGDGEAAIVVDEIDGGPIAALDQQLDRAVGKFEQLQNAGHRADLVDVVGARIVLGGIALGREQNLSVIGHGVLQSLHRALPAYKQGQHHMRIDHDIAQRQEG